MPACTTRRDDAVHFWPEPPKAPPKSQRHGQIQIGVVHHGQRVLGPHFHLHFGQVLDRGRGDALAHGHRAGEGDRVDLRAFDQPLADISGPRP